MEQCNSFDVVMAVGFCCGCVVVWLCGCVVCGCVVVWLCGCGDGGGGGEVS